MAAFVSRLKDRLPPLQINFRERRGASYAIIAVGALLFFGIPVIVETLLIARRSEISDLRAAIDSVQGARTEVRERQFRRDQIAMRYAKKAPLLAGFLQQAAAAQKMEVTDSADHPDVPIGKKYVERSSVIHLKKVGMYNLSKFMETIEKAGEPLAITQLSVRKRTGEPDSWDVELGLSAYDRNEAPAAASSAGSSGAKDNK
jgi:general secretion pathway protein M